MQFYDHFLSTVYDDISFFYNAIYIDFIVNLIVEIVLNVMMIP